MALTIGVGALFIGVVFIIVGWKGHGVDNMNANLAGMLKGQYLPATQGTSSTTSTTQSQTQNRGATATTGGALSPGTNP